MVIKMIFDEFYSIYYRTLDELIKVAINGKLDANIFKQIISEYNFEDGKLFIEEEITNENWNLITNKFETPIINPPQNTLTLLQRRFLKTISQDKRFKLFSDFTYEDDVEPLFNIDDIVYFDQFHNGDDFENKNYIINFRKILDIIVKQTSCNITFMTGKNQLKEVFIIPQRLEYSKKDDKFRIISNKYTVNLSSIITIKEQNRERTKRYRAKKATVEVIIYDKRNALERCMIGFSSYHKETEKLDHSTYKMKLTYYKSDETELVVRFLSFGPLVKVVAPATFVDQIKNRIEKQRELLK